MNVSGSRKTDGVQFAGPENGCVSNGSNVGAISYARRRNGCGNKTERKADRQFESARASKRSGETRRNMERQRKKKQREATEINLAVAQCIR